MSADGARLQACRCRGRSWLYHALLSPSLPHKKQRNNALGLLVAAAAAATGQAPRLASLVQAPGQRESFPVAFVDLVVGVARHMMLGWWVLLVHPKGHLQWPQSHLKPIVELDKPQDFKAAAPSGGESCSEDALLMFGPSAVILGDLPILPPTLGFRLSRVASPFPSFRVWW